MTKIPPWSYSSLTKFETCPRQYYYTRVAEGQRIPEPPTEHTIWGNKVHSALENRVSKKIPLPEGMQQWEPIAAKFDNPSGRVFTETRFALTRNLTPTEWNNSNCWVRGIIDLGVDRREKATLLDFKTGKVKHDIDQLKLFSGLYMQTYPYTEEVRTGFVWLAHDKITREDYTRDNLPEIWQDFIARSERLAAAYKSNKWIPKPSGLCRGWCPVGPDLCEFWEPKKGG